MKKFIAFLLFSLFTVSLLKSQVFINEVNINAYGNKYIQLFISTAGTKYFVKIDYGNPDVSMRNQEIKDKSGNLKEFKTPMEAVNFVEQNGWELVFVLNNIVAYSYTGTGYLFKLRE